MAIKFDLFNNFGEGPDSTGLYINGVSPTSHAIDLRPTIDLHSGHPFDVGISYAAGLLKVAIRDAATGAIVRQKYHISLAAVIGDDTAHVGFTAGTGGQTSSQYVLRWKFGR